MKLLISGAAGQLGSNLVEVCQSQAIDLCACDRTALDITDLSAITTILEKEKPDFVVNTAAYTAVDKAETEQKKAFAINHFATENLAKACAEYNVPLIHISTDYVFDGRKQSPYIETDIPAPTSIYGLSKLRGEEAIRTHCTRHIILRVSWVFGFHGNNFVKTIQRLAREREELSIVEDQKGCPTATDNISQVILSILKQMQSNTFDKYGTYHYCDAPESNWYAFANAIIEATQKYEQLTVKRVNAIPSRNFPTPATRPMNSRMDCSKLKKVFNIDRYSWRISLEKLVKALTEKQNRAE
ncbi:MAG TPA: dTDP-4-dehydrorhamnose reductase [Gammaproteobacteria bacterium]|nr:dTDP-4-dehydrorhamnose reductase [Gammaproteobacteria bacterium]